MKLRGVDLIGKFKITRDEPPSPTYQLLRSSETVDEGQQITITLTTTNVAPGTSIPYTITGVTSADLSGASLTGSFVVSGTYLESSAILNLNVAADFLTEGTETLTIELDNGLATLSSTIQDTSINPTYSLSRSTIITNEGTQFTITLNTTGVASGTAVPYTITGVSSADLSGASLTGSFVVVGTLASAQHSIQFNVANDSLTEDVESFTLALNNGAASATVVINDTSISAPTYSLTRSALITNEGTQFTITLNTTGVAPGTAVPYTITGVSSADLNGASLTGSFVVSGTLASAQHSVQFNVTNDSLTEGTESFTLSLNNGAASAVVVINDTSTNPSVIVPNTTLLLHFDGANGGTSILNSSADTSVTCTAVGSAVLSSASSKFGGTSLYLPATGASASSVSVNPASSFNLSPSTPFTIEMWINPTYVDGSIRQIITQWSNTDPAWALGMVSGYLRWVQHNGAGAATYTFGPALTANVWQHIALTKDASNVVRAFVNGSQVGSSITPVTVRASNAPVIIGDLYSPPRVQLYVGYIDELMMKVGEARYTSNFTPESYPYA